MKNNNLKFNSITVPTGNDALNGLAELPLLRKGTWLTITDSHDVTGDNDDGFNASYSYLYKQGKEYVLFEETGPGCVYVVRTIGHKGNLKIYLNGAEKPSYSIPFPELNKGEKAPFVKPFTGHEDEVNGSSWSYVPIPFSQGCKLTTDEMGKPHFFTIFAHKYAQETKVEDFNAELSFSEAKKMWEAPEKSYNTDSKQKKINKSCSISPREKKAIVDIKGKGAITSLKIRFPNGKVSQTANLVLRAYWDGREHPQVDTPLSTFFALGCPRAIRSLPFIKKDELETEHAICGVVAPKSLVVGQDDNNCLYCNLPMPYWKTARIDLINVSDTAEVEVEFDISYSDIAYPDETGYFHAQWRQETPLRDGEDYCVLDTRGYGHYIGCVMTFSTLYRDSPNKKKWKPRLFLEGDARFYVDDNATPLIASTGTEEYFNWGWYDMLPHDQVFQFPTHGYPFHMIDNEDHSVMYRFHFTDIVPFYRSFRFELEHGPSGREIADYSSTAFYYQRETPVLMLTDELDIGNPESEEKHKYSVDGLIEKTYKIVPYEGSYQLDKTDDEPCDREHAVKDVGNVWNKSCNFEIAVQPDNIGVKIRRRSYFGFGADKEKLGQHRPEPVFVKTQIVTVNIDGVDAGKWYIPANHARDSWRDTEFELPPALTANKEKLIVTLTAEDDTCWDEYTYWVYCYKKFSAKQENTE